MKLNVFNSVDQVLERLAEYFIVAATESVIDHDSFTVALSGGASPERLYSLLASPVFNERINWDKVYFFFGDERYVPLTDKASNFRMVKTVFFEPLQINTSQIFAVDTSLPPDQAAKKYMDDISRHFNGAEPRFDLVLLGLGDNSHTASLFPHTEILHDQSIDIKAVFLSDQQVYRITFTAALINMAHRIAYLVYGTGKAEAVHNILEGVNDIDNFPAQLIRPADGKLEWFLDKAAASNITLQA